MTSPAKVRLALENPYVGPRPFEPEDGPRFFGRDREASEVVSLVIAHRALLIYAESGAGKSSLINAGIIPRLKEDEGFEVLPPARVRGLIPQSISYEDISNVYVFNTLLSWAGQETYPQEFAQVSLADFLRKVEHATDEHEQTAPRVVIFDQFEELFTFYPERWKDREDFFHQFRAALEEDPLLRVIFVMREDYIAQLDPYAYLMPEGLRTHFRLERMGREAALAAVTGPMRDSSRTYGEGVAESLVTELLKTQVQVAPDETVEVAGRYVEPVQLQVVCEGLWRELPPEVSVVQQSHLRTFGDVDRALARFYENCIRSVSHQTGIGIDDLRGWFDQTLITPAGTRGSVFRGSDETAGISNRAVDLLENLHLIRAEVRAGSRWYELTHDRFIEPIRDANRQSGWTWIPPQVRERQARRRRTLITYGLVLSGIVIMVLVTMTGFALQQSATAESRRRQAETAQAEAGRQANLAEDQRQQAETAQAEARRQADLAEERRRQAETAQAEAVRQAVFAKTQADFAKTTQANAVELAAETIKGFTNNIDLLFKLLNSSQTERLVVLDRALGFLVAMSNVHINGGGNTARAAPDSAVEVSLDYSIRGVNCAGCILQIQVGFSHEPKFRDCIYDGQPGMQTVSGSAKFSITAPTDPGVYYLAYGRSAQLRCHNIDKWVGDPADPPSASNGRLFGVVIVE